LTKLSLTCGRENEHAGSAGLSFGAGKNFYGGQRKGCRLAGAGGGLTQDVAAFDEFRNCGGLNRSRLFKAQTRNGLAEFFGKPQRSKGGGHANGLKSKRSLCGAKNKTRFLRQHPTDAFGKERAWAAYSRTFSKKGTAVDATNCAIRRQA